MKPIYKICLVIFGALFLSYVVLGFRTDSKRDSKNELNPASKAISRNILTSKIQLNWDSLEENYGIALTMRK